MRQIRKNVAKNKTKKLWKAQIRSIVNKDENHAKLRVFRLLTKKPHPARRQTHVPPCIVVFVVVVVFLLLHLAFSSVVRSSKAADPATRILCPLCFPRLDKCRRSRWGYEGGQVLRLDSETTIDYGPCLRHQHHCRHDMVCIRPRGWQLRIRRIYTYQSREFRK